MNRPGTPAPAWLRPDHRALTEPLPVEPLRVGPVFESAPALRAHCHVRRPGVAPAPGLIVTWMREPTTWRAHAVHIVGDDDPAVVATWIDAERLQPAVKPMRAHCWVADPAVGRDVAGLVVTWARMQDSWEAQVVRLHQDGPVTATITSWLPAHVLRPV